MKWTYNIRNKMTAALVLLVLCTMILLNNFNDRRNSRQVENAMITMYDDRLVAESYIFRLSGFMHQVSEVINNEALSPSEVSAAIAKINAEVNMVNSAYEKTRFTPAEEAKYLQFKTLCSSIANNSGAVSMQQKKQFAKDAQIILNSLSAIQVAESRSIIDNSEKIFTSGRMSSEFEMAMVVIIALIMQALVFASKTINRNESPVSPHLN